MDTRSLCYAMGGALFAGTGFDLRCWLFGRKALHYPPMAYICNLIIMGIIHSVLTACGFHPNFRVHDYKTSNFKSIAREQTHRAGFCRDNGI